MKIIDLFRSGKPVVSFEVFPPKPEMPVSSVYGALEKLTALGPGYMSVTYGAAGGSRNSTIEISSTIKACHGIESMAHFTCAGHSYGEIDNMLLQLKENGLENILALRGDPPADDPGFDFSKGAYRYASELISHIRSSEAGRNLCIAAAAYTEGHTESLRLKDDLEHLRHKVDCGVDFLVTQLFFDNRSFYNFMDRAAGAGISCPVTAGIMPVYKADQIKRIAALCGASIPAKLVLLMDKYGASPDDMRKAGIEYAAAQIRDLVENNTAGIHLYTMNRPVSAAEIIDAAGIGPA